MRVIRGPRQFDDQKWPCDAGERGKIRIGMIPLMILLVIAGTATYFGVTGYQKYSREALVRGQTDAFFKELEAHKQEYPPFIIDCFEQLVNNKAGQLACDEAVFEKMLKWEAFFAAQKKAWMKEADVEKYLSKERLNLLILAQLARQLKRVKALATNTIDFSPMQQRGSAVALADVYRTIHIKKWGFAFAQILEARKIPGLVPYCDFAEGVLHLLRGDYKSCDKFMSKLIKEQRFVTPCESVALVNTMELALFITKKAANTKKKVQKIQQLIGDPRIKTQFNAYMLEYFQRPINNPADYRERVLVYQTLKVLIAMGLDATLPTVSKPLHMRLAAQHNKRGQAHEAFFHYLLIARVDPEASIPDGFRFSDIRGRLTNAFLGGQKDKALREIFLWILAASRAGYYVPYVMDSWLHLWDQKGILDEAVKGLPGHSAPRFWRAMVWPNQDFQSEAAKARFKRNIEDFNAVLADAKSSSVLRAMALVETVHMSLAMAGREPSNQPNEADRAKLKRALQQAKELLHPKPDQWHLAVAKLAFIERDYAAVLKSLEAALAALQDRHKRTSNETLGEGRPNHAALAPITDEDLAAISADFLTLKGECLMAQSKVKDALTALRASMSSRPTAMALVLSCQCLEALKEPHKIPPLLKQHPSFHDQAMLKAWLKKYPPS